MGLARVRKVLFNPMFEKYFLKILAIYKKELYSRLSAGHTESLLELLDIREQFSDEDAKVLTTLVKLVRKERCKIIEIGSWKGFSTYVLAKSVFDVKGNVFAVDTWGGSGTKIHKPAKSIDVFTIFKHNMKILGVEKVVKPIKMSSQDAHKLFFKNSVNLIFIDGDHTYENFKKDVVNFWPKLKIGGIMCGHDCEGYYGRFSKKRKNQIDNSLREDYVSHIGHPGIIKGLSEIFGQDFMIAPSGIWWLVKKNSKFPINSKI